MTKNQPTQKFQSTGKKKTSVASVTLTNAKEGSFVINKRSSNNYFQGQDLYESLSLSPLVAAGLDTNSFSIIVKACGGGLVSQATSIRHAIAKIVSEMFPEKREIVKKLGFLTRDSRIVERKKPGLRKARRKEQFSKR
ncbi:MAG: 30S ribosomal protein S9 [Proteobacteria bacterium]|jgi:small subunit ribosomal protein S9|nr:30S ribosomal protein S9 [Pseudomonadota bacterium]